MKAQKFTFKDTKKVDLKTKVIYKYPSLSRLLELNYMVVNGRHPENKNEYILEHDCQFIIYATKGSGKIYAGKKTFDVKIGDAVYAPIENKFAAEGKNFEYITVETLAWYLEQAEVVSE
jgi:mannose-6-phosphate isomerase-like protein (cupin superfamily)